MSRDFNGTSDIITCGSAADLNNLSQFTYAAWISPDTLPNDEHNVMTKGKTNFKQLAVGQLFQGVGARAMWCYINYSGTDSFARSTSTTLITLGAWQFVAGTMDTTGTNTPLLYHGLSPTAVASVAVTTQVPTGTVGTDATGFLALGARSGASNDNFYDGKLAHVHVYNRILTLAEVQQLAARPGSISRGLLVYERLSGASPEGDYSGNGHGGTLTGTAVSALSPPISGEGAFEGGRRGL